MMALAPEAHTLLTVVQTQVSGMPAARAACLAGAWPTFPVSTLPMNTSCTSAGATRARRSASRMLSAPSAGAGSDASVPLMLPMGVRATPQMNPSRCAAMAAAVRRRRQARLPIHAAEAERARVLA